MNLRLGFAAALALSPLLAIGCSDLGSPQAPVGRLSTTVLDFGTITTGDTAERTVTISNSGTAPLSGEAIVGCVPYSLVSGGGAFTVSPGGRHDVVVRFSPGSAGTFACALSLGGGLPAVGLIGQAGTQLPGAECVVTPTTLDFGSVQVSSAAVNRTFSIANPGTAPTSLDVRSDDPDFTVTSGMGPRMLAPGQSLQVTVEFRSSASGRDSALIATGPGCPQVRCRGVGLTVHFSTDILFIFNTRGCNSGCHTRLFNSAASIVNVTTAGYAPAKYIVPFDLSGSVIYGKVTNSGQYGQSMPQGSPLIPLAERNRIRDWILEGALAN